MCTRLIAGFVTMRTNYSGFADQFESNNELIAMDDFPTFIKMPNFSSGFNFMILMVICMLIGIIMWYPFLENCGQERIQGRRLESERMKAQETLREAEMAAERNSSIIKFVQA